MENMIWLILSPEDKIRIAELKKRVAEIETPADALLWALRKVALPTEVPPHNHKAEVNYGKESITIDDFPTPLPIKDILHHKNWSKFGIRPVLKQIDVSDPKYADLLYDKFCIVPYRGTSIKEEE